MDQNNQEDRLNDYVRRWGNAQKCSSCGYIMPYGPFDKIHNCCGKLMTPEKEEVHTQIELPTYYSAQVSFVEENGRYFMVIAELNLHRVEISESFYQSAVAEFQDADLKFEKIKD